MSTFAWEISEFLRQNGFDCVTGLRGGMTMLWVEVPAGTEDDPSVGTATSRCIVLWPIESTTTEEAQGQARQMAELLGGIAQQGDKPIVITQDRWRRQQGMMQARLLAHLERFIPMYARNCEVRKIDKEIAAAFLKDNHSYGDAACKYRYGLYLKRYTGKRAEISRQARNDSEDRMAHPGTLVAVATFSNARKWQKGEKTIRSYEWTRYASLPGVRISGGMGKVLKAFIKDVQPDDIMSYADLEWSEGTVYEQLGFELEGHKAPVMFVVDSQWQRFPVKPGMTTEATPLYLQNLGSNKYRMKLTEYE